MEPNPEPLHLADPRLLAGHTLLGRLGSHGAGTVYLAEDARREKAVVGVLHPTAAADPGVRARLASAVSGFGAGRQVTGSTDVPPIWVAVPYGGGALEDVLRLLDAAALSTGEPTPANVPAFAPHWSAEPHDPPPVPTPTPTFTPPLSPSRGVPVFVPLAALAVFFCLVIAAVVVLLTGDDEQTPTITASSPVISTPAPGSETPAPTPSESGPPPSETPGPSGGKGLVAGPTFGSGDKPYLMRLNGFPFSFNVPEGWGCMRSDKPGFTNRWICVHEGKGFPPTGGTSAGGLVALQSCPSGCGPTQRETARNALAVDHKSWHATDPTTQYAEETGSNSRNETVVRVAMSHVFASRKGGPLDTAVAVQLTGPPNEKTDMQKTLNDIRHNTP
ncbi:hypothetical protein DZF91_01890 [Actinomadura logoneensis]|uniref:Uncharacterized protein n=1 Tax=Actinomadura logoneensis TaxID=2293572 RepID=A0A372JUB0_9ACTN|nr:hypothetical protein [Actinomadura logoneensis]RFU43314.1 hypothetical protein DZF91_01890 [Actinomadura logoneensis]